MIDATELLHRFAGKRNLPTNNLFSSLEHDVNECVLYEICVVKRWLRNLMSHGVVLFFSFELVYERTRNL